MRTSRGVGLRFKSKDLTTFFKRYSWYQPTADGVDDRLTALDQENIAAVQAAARRKRSPLPGGVVGPARLAKEVPSNPDTQLHWFEIADPGGLGGIRLVLEEDGKALLRSGWASAEAWNELSGQWFLDWPYVVVLWRESRGSRGVGQPLPTGGGNVDSWASYAPYSYGFFRTQVIDWRAQETTLVERAAAALNLEVPALRGKLEAGAVDECEVWKAAGESVWGDWPAGSPETCVSSSCTRPDGRPCAFCTSSSGQPCVANVECVTGRCEKKKCR